MIQLLFRFISPQCPVLFSPFHRELFHNTKHNFLCPFLGLCFPPYLEHLPPQSTAPSILLILSSKARALCQVLSQVLHPLGSILWHFYPKALLVLFFEPFSNLCCFRLPCIFRQLSYLTTRKAYVVMKRPWFKSQSCHWKAVWTWAKYLFFRVFERWENECLSHGGLY